jgi:hypothetical protein
MTTGAAAGTGGSGLPSIPGFDVDASTGASATIPGLPGGGAGGGIPGIPAIPGFDADGGFGLPFP